MARFDVYETRDGDYILDCQADILSHYSTRFVVPLLRSQDALIAAGKLNPVFSVNDETVFMYTHFAAAIPVADLGRPITSLEQHDFEIIAALDMLISGY